MTSANAFNRKPYPLYWAMFAQGFDSILAARWFITASLWKHGGDAELIKSNWKNQQSPYPFTYHFHDSVSDERDLLTDCEILERSLLIALSMS